jgi:hypothetical protein
MRLKKVLKTSLAQFGYRLERIERIVPSGGDFDPSTPLPADAVEELRPDHPWLLELEHRYRSFESPVCKHTLWEFAATHNRLNHLRYFRGDNGYMWLYRSNGDMRRRFYVYAQHVRNLDTLGLMGAALTEDGAFGCFTYRYEMLPTVSRDLLDSINELYFLERHSQLLSGKIPRVLDIGAGYGRLAHRMLAATDTVERYWCIDAIPRSTFVSAYYLRHRGLAGSSSSRAVVVPLDEMERAIPVGSVDLAVNVHSFSEMSYDAIDAWVQWLVKLQVPRLFLVPNTPQLLSMEADGARRDFSYILDRAGFRRTVHEPTLRDPDLRELVGVSDEFWLFERG